jgi:thiamine transport system permease protein
MGPAPTKNDPPALHRIRSNLHEAAPVMGADPPRVWREVDLPVLGRALLIGGAFAFAISLDEFGATAMIARAEMPTRPYAIFRTLGQPGWLNYGQAMALSARLMLVVDRLLTMISPGFRCPLGLLRHPVLRRPR